MRLFISTFLAGAALFGQEAPRPPQADAERPLFRMVELASGESAGVELSNGQKVRIKLVEVRERRDPIRSAVRDSSVKVEINGEAVTLGSGNYRLPVTAAGVQIDCPITRPYYADARHDYWGLVKDARLRLWPAGSPWARPGAFVYPVRQRWFASGTHMTNEPCFIDGGEESGPGKIYYHFGLDFGGCELLVDAVSVTDGVVVGSRGEIQPEHQEVKPLHGFKADQVLIRDPRAGTTDTPTSARSTPPFSSAERSFAGRSSARSERRAARAGRTSITTSADARPTGAGCWRTGTRFFGKPTGGSSLPRSSRSRGRTS